MLELFSIEPYYDPDSMTRRQALPNLTASIMADFDFAPTEGAETGLIAEDLENAQSITGNRVIDALMTVVRTQGTGRKSGEVLSGKVGVAGS